MDRIRTISPVDGQIYVERTMASAGDISASIARAEKAQSYWQALPLSARKVFCSKAVEYLVANKRVIAEEITWMMGRPIAFSGGEVDGVEERARHMIAIAEDSLASIALPDKPGFNRYIKRVPLGTVFVIAPWNYPYLTAINAIIPALLAGNTVVLKHSAQTPLCAERLFEAFQHVGLPEGVFQYLHLSHADTEKVIQATQVRHVAFTGSVPGGAMVEKAVAGRFISSGLELGGKDPAYIRKDADIETAVETVIDGAFFNSGQSCCGIERLYIHQSIYDEVIEKSVEVVRRYQLGRPDDTSTTLGPLVKTGAADFVRGQVDEAIRQGAMPLIDQSEFAMHKPGTPYLAPQLLSHVNHSMRVMHEETFGPVLGVMSVADDHEALSLMNDSEFGLTAAVFTQDQQVGERLADDIDTGTVFLNRCDYLDPGLAWVGVKNSGRGCTLSQVGFEMLTRPKSYHIKKPGGDK
ncbi:aldehyde dehydrogenase family protein [Veronia pacifica]|uniref:Aldehyde dehydrogenase n=1 Tax=Veronia pacifica TaxID=1080227 RepID=A0A1C3EBZ5_9GAMM|nr:aldehyde dehydrogenase family protein [Veronia pacifica]ODA30714.1 aldehyde dehydrogenase [Veronia pacifica]